MQLTPAVQQQILARSLELAQALFKNQGDTTTAAQQDAQKFLADNQEQMAEWLTLVSTDEWTQDQYADTVAAELDLETLPALQAKAAREVALQAFGTSIAEIAIQVGLTTAFGPGGSIAAAVVNDVIQSP